MIYHIYWGTSGNSGLYLDEIYQVLDKAGVKQKAFVSYYYPFDYGEKIFFKKSDIAHTRLTGRKRAIVQLWELFVSFITILKCAKKDKPRIVNYSNVGTDYFFIYWFVYLLKKISDSKLIVTCHDVLPHSVNDLRYRKKILNTADHLLVHADNSIDELKVLDINVEKVVKHPFPIMDLSKMPGFVLSKTKDTDFLFIGHLRKDKGIELLLDTWPEFHKINSQAKLKICGKPQPGVKFDKLALERYNVEFCLEYISNEDYVRYISSARCVVLPYIQGTNSGIISTVLSLGTDVLTSDIPMFNNNPLVRVEDMFKSMDSISLCDAMGKKFGRNSGRVVHQVESYKLYFAQCVLNVYSTI